MTAIQSTLQVLSESVGHALSLFGGPEAEETAKFASTFDKFFDSLNSRNCVTAKQKRKIFLRPYFSGQDFRLNVSIGLYPFICVFGVIFESGSALESLSQTQCTSKTPELLV